MLTAYRSVRPGRGSRLFRLLIDLSLDANLRLSHCYLLPSRSPGDVKEATVRRALHVVVGARGLVSTSFEAVVTPALQHHAARLSSAQMMN